MDSNLYMNRQETKNLFLYYMARQAVTAKATLPTKVVDQLPTRLSGQNHNVRSLKALTEKLIFYKQRRWAHKLAQTVYIYDIEEESLRKILLCIFQKGENDLERVLLVFHFCSHLCIRSLVEHEDRVFFNLYRWILAYLTDSFSPWIDHLGGWEVLLNKSAPKYVNGSSVIGVCLGMVAVYLAVKSNQ